MRSELRILRAGDHRRMPWKNGGGETTEIAAFPADASLDTFQWRVSMARVASDGAFSLFPGIDRTLTVLDGAGLQVRVGASEPHALRLGDRPFAFPGDVDTHATLIDGAITDLNVMTRRGSWAHAVRAIRIGGEIQITLAASLTLLLSHDAACVVQAAHQSCVLAPGDAVLAETLAGDTWRLQSPGQVFAIELTPSDTLSVASPVPDPSPQSRAD